MKKSKVLILSLITVATLAVSFVSVAQQEKKKKRDEARKEIKAYMKAQVLPVVLENRKEFDNKLSNSEKKTLVSLRERLDALSKKKEGMKRPEGEPTEEQQKERQAMEKEMRHITTAAWEIVDNHEADLEAIKASTKTQQEQWKSDMKAIMSKYKPENKGEGNGHEKGNGRKGRGKGKMGRQGMMGHYQPVMFVLMDPSKSVDELADEMEKRQMKRMGHKGGKGRGHHGGGRN
ncbi:hypothetical protein [Flammeovirga sp. EKP202]|uniref:hypothetical protein n=1 Tax=Flammeovirga sp. EKP202 TaxID=2770592 RepID=UPI00165F33DD|nr:hypothetical protein [Flammeovirga sp. EKP202]MBD0404590.1 hypothetical protein [Flammeovirga sp. EKP202]